MKLMALEDPPPLEQDWESKALEAAERHREAALALLDHLECCLPPDEARKAANLFVAVNRAGDELWNLTLQQSAFFRWAAARWFHRATGRHMETGASGRVSPDNDADNIYDIRSLLAHRR